MSNSSKILVALGAGMLLGVVLGILFAPAKGFETRKRISAGGRKFSDGMKSRFDHANEKFSETKGFAEEYE